MTPASLPAEALGTQERGPRGSPVKAGFLPFGAVGPAWGSPARPLGCHLPRGCILAAAVLRPAPSAVWSHARCSFVTLGRALDRWTWPRAWLDPGSPHSRDCPAQSPRPAPLPTCPHASSARGCSVSGVCSPLPRVCRGPGLWASPDPSVLQQACWAWKMTGTSSPWSSTTGTPGGSPSRTSASCHLTTRSSVSGGLGPPPAP